METLQLLSDSEIANLRQIALSQACHDDRGQVPQEDTLAKAQAYFDFLIARPA